MMDKNLTLLGWNLGDPTPNQIARRAAEIRKHWTQQEHDRRAGAYANRTPFETPTCNLHATLNFARTLEGP